jgi:glycosyl transferase family 25
MFDAIERVVYINLDERVDRKLQVQQELLKVFPAEKIKRFAAIRTDFGGIGCTMSHIAVLEMAKREGWSNVLIVEDDFVWASRIDTSSVILKRLMSNPYDAIVLGGTLIRCDMASLKLESCQSTTAYIVDRSYIDRMLENYKEGLQKLQETGDYPTYALDQYWKRLHASGRWYIVMPIMGAQRPGYSDIEKRNVNYLRLFGLAVK